jgi:hypothetical protein
MWLQLNSTTPIYVDVHLGGTGGDSSDGPSTTWSVLDQRRDRKIELLLIWNRITILVNMLTSKAAMMGWVQIMMANLKPGSPFAWFNLNIAAAILCSSHGVSSSSSWSCS